MKRMLILPVLLAAGIAVAQTPAAPGVPSAPAPAGTAPAVHVGPAKIGVIAFQVAVSQTNEFQRDFSDLEKKYEPKRQQLKALSDEVDTLTKQMQTQAATLNDAQRADRAHQIDDKKKQLDRSAQNAQNDYQGEVQELFSTTAQKVYDVLSTYAQQRGYTLVLDISGKQTPIMYALPATNITKDVVAAYNLKSGVPAPPPPAPAPASHTHPSTAPKGPGR